LNTQKITSLSGNFSSFSLHLTAHVADDKFAGVVNSNVVVHHSMFSGPPRHRTPQAGDERHYTAWRSRKWWRLIQPFVQIYNLPKL